MYAGIPQHHGLVACWSNVFEVGTLLYTKGHAILVAACDILLSRSQLKKRGGKVAHKSIVDLADL